MKKIICGAIFFAFATVAGQGFAEPSSTVCANEFIREKEKAFVAQNGYRPGSFAGLYKASITLNDLIINPECQEKLSKKPVPQKYFAKLDSISGGDVVTMQLEEILTKTSQNIFRNTGKIMLPGAYGLPTDTYGNPWISNNGKIESVSVKEESRKRIKSLDKDTLALLRRWHSDILVGKVEARANEALVNYRQTHGDKDLSLDELFFLCPVIQELVTQGEYFIDYENNKIKIVSFYDILLLARKNLKQAKAELTATLDEAQVKPTPELLSLLTRIYRSQTSDY